MLTQAAACVVEPRISYKGASVAMDLFYWRRATFALLRHLRDRDFARLWLTAGIACDAAPKAKVRELHDAYPAIETMRVDLGHVRFGRSNMDPLELYVVAALGRIRNARMIFEIGTYDGATTALLARANPAASIFTLDLPTTEHYEASVAEEARNIRSGGVGSLVSPAQHDHVTQLRGDSRTFDFSPWYGRVDMVIVDGGHTYDCVAADSDNALKMIHSGGLVVWDDYIPGWPEVVSVVDGLPEEIRLRIFRPNGTQLAVYDPMLTS